ncbi:alpha/beta hydrolase [Nocardioides sp. HM23]|uniref:alpha/beta fold hydrolase n=1 Tax=Nocardioides bizhenqiangii TaxID=3095076 RepID=UPI002ACB0398|nr:alpha/beta hydrolase [Nocardioides sp. HM23]MDZ5619306.1 alpha/beta hydrolase [Nocardioides sp. HM23]
MPVRPTTRKLFVRDTTLAADIRGEGSPLLLIHGGGEDATMLAAQAESLAAAGYQVTAYDRRGTGRSGRDSWPGGGAAQHADDARALIEAVGLDSPTVVGVSSGAVIALALAARHPRAVGRVVAWEPPALGVVPGGGLAQRVLMVPSRRHLRRHPSDYVGAQAVLLKLILGRPVTVDDPALAATRANAEAMIRDEPGIPTYRLRRRDLAGVDITVGLGSETIPPIRIAARRITSWTGRPPVRGTGEHEVYLSDPSVLTGIVERGRPRDRTERDHNDD